MLGHAPSYQHFYKST